MHFPDLAKSHFKIKKTEAFVKNTTDIGAMRLLSADKNKKIRSVTGKTLDSLADNFYTVKMIEIY